ncbi:TIR domain-containing protein [Mycolicibacterium sp. 120270]|uniref:WD40 domain-containing protein n=1 Tax=Mycolicibacterium sp. 120270 TaxID=3090600 RepID=UPI00299E533F|nr:TIR domain-containing protein [Mycolicibacterium sp. 120270]MDX1882126.1 TIR domain-containing protein [Mycolicibacterium sp. 120270]
MSGPTVDPHRHSPELDPSAKAALIDFVHEVGAYPTLYRTVIAHYVGIVMAADVFLSYSRRESKEFVARLAAALDARIKDAWVDLEDIPPASQFMEDLKEGIGGSDAFCFVLSDGALESEYCLRELEYAVERNKRIIPIAHRRLSVTPPEPLASHSWVPQEGLFEDDFDAGVDELVVAMETDIDWVRGHTKWGQRADGWQRGGHDRGALLRGQELADAEAWLAGQADNKPAPTASHTEFIVRSQREARNRTRRMLSAVAAALVVSLVLAGVAFWQRSVAIEQRDNANSRALASVTLRAPDPTLAVLLSEEALDRAETPEAEAALQLALARLGRQRAVGQGSNFNAVAVAPDGTVYTGGTTGKVQAWTAEESGEHGFKLGEPRTLATLPQSDGAAPVTAIAMSSDATNIAIGTDRGPMRIVTGDGSEVRTVNPGSAVSAIAYSPNGTQLAIGGQNGHVTIWDSTSGRQQSSLVTGDTPVMSLAWTPDGRRLMTATDGGLTQLWNVDGGQQLWTQPGGVAAMARDGGRIAVANAVGQDRGLVTIYSDTGERLVSIPSGTEEHGALAFSPDGAKLIAVDWNGVGREHDSRDGERIGTLDGHVGMVRSIAFSPDARFVFTASLDSTLRVWEMNVPKDMVTFSVGDSSLLAAKFSPDGERVAIGGVGGWAIFDARTADRLLTFDAGPGVVFDLQFSPDGHRLATAEDDGRARIWNVDTGKMVSEFDGHAKKLVAGIAFSPDGKLVASAGSGEVEAARIWNPDDGTQVRALTSDGVASADATGARSVAFSPDGSMVVTGTDKGAQIWDMPSGQLRLTFDGHGGVVSGVVFTPGNKQVVSVGPDGAMLLWDATTGAVKADLRHDAGSPIRVDVSSDGRFAVAGYSGAQAAVFDLAQAELGGSLALIGGHKGKVVGVDFSPNDARIITVGDAGVALLDRCTVCRPLPELREMASQLVVRDLTADERERYVPVQ